MQRKSFMRHAFGGVAIYFFGGVKVYIVMEIFLRDPFIFGNEYFDLLYRYQKHTKCLDRMKSVNYTTWHEYELQLTGLLLFNIRISFFRRLCLISVYRKCLNLVDETKNLLSLYNIESFLRLIFVFLLKIENFVDVLEIYSQLNHEIII